MPTTITIGADELILWLRKNNKGLNVPNDGAQGLGLKILKLVEELGGEKISENHDTHWANEMNDKNIGQYNLPKTSAQYHIDTQQLGQLYETLSGW